MRFSRTMAETQTLPDSIGKPYILTQFLSFPPEIVFVALLESLSRQLMAASESNEE